MYSLKLLVKIPKKLNKINRSYHSCSHVWHIDIAKCAKGRNVASLQKNEL